MASKVTEAKSVAAYDNLLKDNGSVGRQWPRHNMHCASHSPPGSAYHDVVASYLQVAVFFWAPWSQPCKQLHLVFEQLAKDNSDVRFVQVISMPPNLLPMCMQLQCRIGTTNILTDLRLVLLCRWKLKRSTR